MYHFTASAPAKVIVSGEHAVVYGYPALLSATDLRLEWNFQFSQKSLIDSLHKQLCSFSSLEEIFTFLTTHSDIQTKLRSNIPVGSGLGSSAAFSVSLASVLLSESASLAEINQLAYQFETLQHGKPSGGDNTVSCYGGVLWYRKENEHCKLFQSLTPQKKFPQLWLIDSGAPKESIKFMVELVRAKREYKKESVESAFREMERIARGWLQFLLEQENVAIDELIRENHTALNALGVVSNATNACIEQIKSLGGSAKITGAGGVEQGSGMVLVYHQDREKLRAWAKSKQYILAPVHLGGPGLKQKREKIETKP